MLHGGGPGRTIGKIGYFALIGFLAILLAGPVIGILSALVSLFLAIFSVAITVFVVILPFAMIGFLVLAPIEAVRTGRPIEWRRLREICVGLWAKTLGVAWWVWRKLLGFISFLRRRVAALAIYVRVVFWEVICGALVGAFLGWMMARHEMDKPHIIIGALIGAILGALVGASRHEIADPALPSPAEPAQ